MKYKVGDILTNGRSTITIKGVLFDCTYVAFKSDKFIKDIPQLWSQDELDRIPYKLKTSTKDPT